MQRVLHFVKNRDTFGHHVQFTINGGNGTAQTSKIGGFISICIYVFVATYVGIRCQKMLKGSFDNINQTEQYTNFE